MIRLNKFEKVIVLEDDTMVSLSLFHYTREAYRFYEAEEDIAELFALVSKHADFTKSSVAKGLLAEWASSVSRFVKVLPTDYKRVMLEMKREQELQLV